MIITSH